jgi:hypothetical protein
VFDIMWFHFSFITWRIYDTFMCFWGIFLLIFTHISVHIFTIILNCTIFVARKFK